MRHRQFGGLDTSELSLSCLDRCACLPVNLAPSDGFPFVVQLFAFGQREQHLHTPTFEVHFERHKGQSLLGRLTDKLSNFVPMQQELSLPQFRVLRVSAVAVRTDVHVCHPDLPVFDSRITVTKVDASLTDRFHLRSEQRHAALECLDDVVVVASFPILGDDAPCGLTRGLLGHA